MSDGYVLILGGSRYASAWKHWLDVERVAREHVSLFGRPSDVWDGGQTGIDDWGSQLARTLGANHLVHRARDGSAEQLASRTRRMVAAAPRETVHALVFPMLGQKNPGSNLLYSLMTEIVGAEEHRLVRRFIEP